MRDELDVGLRLGGQQHPGRVMRHVALVYPSLADNARMLLASRGQVVVGCQGKDVWRQDGSHPLKVVAEPDSVIKLDCAKVELVPGDSRGGPLLMLLSNCNRSVWGRIDLPRPARSSMARFTKSTNS